jgi:hypothetical protein
MGSSTKMCLGTTSHIWANGQMGSHRKKKKHYDILYNTQAFMSHVS